MEFSLVCSLKWFIKTCKVSDSKGALLLRYSNCNKYSEAWKWGRWNQNLYTEYWKFLLLLNYWHIKRGNFIAEKKNNNERSMIGASTSNRSVNTTSNELFKSFKRSLSQHRILSTQLLKCWRFSFRTLVSIGYSCNSGFHTWGSCRTCSACSACIGCGACGSCGGCRACSACAACAACSACSACAACSACSFCSGCGARGACGACCRCCRRCRGCRTCGWSSTYQANWIFIKTDLNPLDSSLKYEIYLSMMLFKVSVFRYLNRCLMVFRESHIFPYTYTGW